MNPFFILLFVCTLAALIYWFKNASRAQGVLALKGFLIVILLLIIIVVVTGRVPLFSALPLLVLGLFRKFAMYRLIIPIIKSLAGTRSSQTMHEQSTEDLSPRQCLEVLGLEEDPSRQQIIDAHRRLIKRVHPDHGGSDYQAKQANLARDTLLEKFKK